MKRNKLKVLSSLAILGIAGLGLAACNNNTGSGTTQSPTTTPTENGGGATTPTPTPTPVPTTPSQSTTTTPNQSSTNTPEQNKIESISVSGQTKEFLPGSEFVFGGTVTKNYSDGSQVVATEEEYIVTIYTDNSYETEAENIKTSGTYYVVVSIGDKLATYEIVVREKQQTIHENAVVKGVTPTKTDISTKVDIYNQHGNEVYVTANSSKKIQSEDKTATCDGIEFSQRLKMQGSAVAAGESVNVSADGTVSNGRVIVVKVAQASKLTFYGMPSSEQKRSFILTNNADYSREVASAADKTNIGSYEFDVAAGTYYFYVGATNATLGTTAGGWYFYGVDIAYDVPASSLTYSEIKVDASNVRTDFNLNDTFSTDGLVVKGKNNLGTWDILSKEDYKVTNTDDTEVSTATPGKKTLKVTAKGHSDTYDIQVINPNATIENIVVKEEAKGVYKQGEVISLSGLVITSTDSDSVTQDIAYDAEKITYKVLDGEADVTSQFTTLTKGTYTVELTYASKTTTYNITMLEVKEGKFEYKNEVAVGSDSYASSLIVSYTDGTDADWSKYNDTILSTAEGYSTKFYSDADCTTLIDTATNAFASVGTVYMKLSYQDYSSNAITLTVKNFNSESYYVKDANLTSGTDYKKQTLFEGNFVDVKVGTGTCKADSNTAINQGEMQIKLDAGDGKEIIFVVKQKITLKIIANASGNKKYIIKDAVGTELKAGDLSKTADGDTTIEITLEAGTYSFTSNGGGVRFAGIEATKAE
ncbi:bacterial group 3 Ig-like protein [Clostridium sp. CAG:307]|nr:bacterial group 3 Ig-like protein [Clostridium sp. CAG:307]